MALKSSITLMDLEATLARSNASTTDAPDFSASTSRLAACSTTRGQFSHNHGKREEEKSFKYKPRWPNCPEKQQNLLIAFQMLVAPLPRPTDRQRPHRSQETKKEKRKKKSMCQSGTRQRETPSRNAAPAPPYPTAHSPHSSPPPRTGAQADRNVFSIQWVIDPTSTRGMHNPDDHLTSADVPSVAFRRSSSFSAARLSALILALSAPVSPPVLRDASTALRAAGGTQEASPLIAPTPAAAVAAAVPAAVPAAPSAPGDVAATGGSVSEGGRCFV